MALYRGDDELEGLRIGALYVGQKCFYCHRPILVNHVLVVWREYPNDLVLHRMCARTLGTHLLVDSVKGGPSVGGQRVPFLGPLACCSEWLDEGNCVHGTYGE